MNATEADFIRALTITSQKALKTGALKTAQTTLSVIQENNIPFQIRVLDGFRKKPRHNLNKPEHKNPFLPYENALYIDHLDSGHVVLLNKYNLAPNHFLIVTPEFEPQESLLKEKEFQAIHEVLDTMPLLVFYNSGKDAGASQPHKHLQALPLDSLPIDEAMQSTSDKPAPVSVLRYKHLAVNFCDRKTPDHSFSLYQLMLSELDLLKKDHGVAPYNLLMTRNWMMIIPRNTGRPEGVPLNALGYAGLLLAKNQDQLASIKATGIFNLLSAAN